MIKSKKIETYGCIYKMPNCENCGIDKKAFLDCPNCNHHKCGSYSCNNTTVDYYCAECIIVLCYCKRGPKGLDERCSECEKRFQILEHIMFEIKNKSMQISADVSM
jgi:hypothetical protein